MSQRDTLVHLFAGGCGGTVGAILTCPLEVVKTRLQSSSVTLYISEVQLSTMAGASVNRVVSPGPLHCLKVILEKEGPRSLFRGLGPNLVGVAPSRAIYFAAYSNCKEKLNGLFDPDSTQVHMISAAMAGFTAITATNPIWLIKTRLQLDARNRGEKRMGAFECVRKVYQTDGLRGFYRGMSASYAGISETVIHFVIYESIKQKLLEYKIASTMENEEESVKEVSDFVGMMLAATSKTCATSIAYPHGRRTDDVCCYSVAQSCPALRMTLSHVQVFVACQALLSMGFPRQEYCSVQFSSVAQSCPTLCNPMSRSTPGLPVHHQLPEFTQTHVH
uniref:Solute carrier family 25 member 36 n=1 Tax=Bos mutus grunniens TaxID=30521 RepID=A0A8B9W8M1_BOSMU